MTGRTILIAFGMAAVAASAGASAQALDIDANPELARGQALLLGYLYRPYTANTGWVRLLYRW